MVYRTARAWALVLGVVLLSSTLPSHTRAADVSPLCSCGAPCDLTLDFAVSLDEVFEACNTIVATAGFSVTGGTTVTLRAGQRVALDNEIQVASTGQLIVDIDPSLFCDTSVDLDGDGFDECLDCNDQASSCTTDCADIDGDLRPDCTDACLDSDGDGYGNDNTGETIGGGFLTVGECTADGASACDLGPVCIDTDCDDGEALVNPGATETCNGADDDCDTLVDANDPSIELGPFNSNQLGVCSGTRMSCVASAWQDDYSSVPLFGLFEEPDASFLDENCDGIDGTMSEAIFVAPTGTNTGTCGTQAAPCQTVSHGLNRAVSAAKPHVYLRFGTYSGALNLVHGVSIYGGYDASWTRDARSLPGHTATMSGGLYAADSAYLVLRARNVTAKVADVVLDGPDAAPSPSAARSSYVVHSIGSTLDFERVSFLQGNGANGAGGSNGLSASAVRAPGGFDGGDADSFTTACNSGSRGDGGGQGVFSCSTGSTAGGAGGGGGTMDTSCGFPPDLDATVGETGDNAVTFLTGQYGYRGAAGSTCGAGGHGLDGRVVNGPGGTGGPSGGTISGGYWFGRDGAAGGIGDDGTGGGGGGGSGGCDTGTDAYGAGGGGGGAGGCRSTSGGGGGKGGGGSFGIYSNNGIVNVFDSLFVGGVGGNGGSGGRGGTGQPGGLGGDGGTGAGGAEAGGNGGDGGRGGHSGGGGGGAGGVSCNIYRQSGVVNQSGNSGSDGTPGSGGLGGLQAGSGGNAGQQGAHGSVISSAVCIDASP